MGIAWDPALITGNRQIDDQHEQIFRMLEALRAAMAEDGGHGEVGRLLGTLSMYVVAHFWQEESLMVQYDCPGLEGHRAAHAQLRGQVDGLVDRFNADGGLPPMELLVFMENWLSEHVRSQDRPMVTFVLAAQEQVS
jgi:hemerythrin